MHLTLLGGEYVDDAKIKFQFELQLGALADSGMTVPGKTLRSQLRKELDFPLSEFQTAVHTPNRDTQTAEEKARAATLVFGHIYKCDRCDDWHSNLAGGVLLSSSGFALTNYHVLDFERGHAFGAMLSDGRLFPVEEILASSKDDDLALVKLGSAAELPYVSWSAEAKVGSPLFVISHPDSHFYALTRGHLSRFSLSPKRKTKRMEITAPFARGSSGSGIFDPEGRLIGLVSSTNTVFYNVTKEEKSIPQLVFYNGIPAVSFLDLFTSGEEQDSP